MDKLTDEQIEQKLEDLGDWSRHGDSLQRTFQFDDFLGAIDFVNRIAELAEDFQHHPDILIRYNKVTLTVTTHDAGGLTERDFTFANATEGRVAAA